MSFPKRNILGIPKGWKDLGLYNGQRSLIKGEVYRDNVVHLFCGDIVSIGKENGKLFTFCKRCGVKTEPKKD
jgi:hypothetical protein